MIVLEVQGRCIIGGSEGNIGYEIVTLEGQGTV
jgi:hypothetical protein